MTAPILFVAGLGRCGTTMVMHMLWRGGFPVAGDPPDFETVNMQLGHVNTEWLREQSGRAVKWIDPVRARVDFNCLLPHRPVVIWLTRDFKEQAKSQLKLIGQRPVRNAVRLMAREIAEDTRQARFLNGIGRRYFPMTFERILVNPKGAAEELGYIVNRYFEDSFDTDLAARAVVARGPECAPDLSIELQLMEDCGVKL